MGPRPGRSGQAKDDGRVSGSFDGENRFNKKRRAFYQPGVAILSKN